MARQTRNTFSTEFKREAVVFGTDHVFMQEKDREMREFNQIIDEKSFNMLWRALSDKETEMTFSIEQDPDSEESALLGNELVYLRLCKSEPEEKASKAIFPPSAFSTDDGFVDLFQL